MSPLLEGLLHRASPCGEPSVCRKIQLGFSWDSVGWEECPGGSFEMTRKFMAMVSAAALAAMACAPIADAHDWRGYHGDYGRHGYYRYGHGNAAAAGAVGLIFGLALGAALSQPRTDRCYDSCG